MSPVIRNNRFVTVSFLGGSRFISGRKRLGLRADLRQFVVEKKDLR